MSYILDALLKADHERQRQQIPSLQTIQTPPQKTARPPRWLAWVSGISLLTGLLAIAGGQWLLQRLTVPPADSAAGPLISPPVVQVAPVHKEAPVLRETAPTPRAAQPSSPAKEIAVSTVGNHIVSMESKPRPDTKIYKLADLPPAVQEEARKLTVSGIAQAPDGNSPMAIINDRALREGDEVMTGLRVERISNEGVILNFKGYRFRKGGA